MPTTMVPRIPRETSEQNAERMHLRDLVFSFSGLIGSMKADADLSALETVAVAAQKAIDRITIECPYELRYHNYWEAEQTLWRFRNQYSHCLLKEGGDLLERQALDEEIVSSAEWLYDHYRMGLQHVDEYMEYA